jgi:hypothetical protein
MTLDDLGMTLDDVIRDLDDIDRGHGDLHLTWMTLVEVTVTVI